MAGDVKDWFDDWKKEKFGLVVKEESCEADRTAVVDTEKKRGGGACELEVERNIVVGKEKTKWRRGHGLEKDEDVVDVKIWWAKKSLFLLLMLAVTGSMFSFWQCKEPSGVEKMSAAETALWGGSASDSDSLDGSDGCSVNSEMRQEALQVALEEAERKEAEAAKRRKPPEPEGPPTPSQEPAASTNIVEKKKKKKKRERSSSPEEARRSSKRISIGGDVSKIADLERENHLLRREKEVAEKERASASKERFDKGFDKGKGKQKKGPPLPEPRVHIYSGTIEEVAPNLPRKIWSSSVDAARQVLEKLTKDCSSSEQEWWRQKYASFGHLSGARGRDVVLLHRDHTDRRVPMWIDPGQAAMLVQFDDARRARMDKAAGSSPGQKVDFIHGLVSAGSFESLQEKASGRLGPLDCMSSTAPLETLRQSLMVSLLGLWKVWSSFKTTHERALELKTPDGKDLLRWCAVTGIHVDWHGIAHNRIDATSDPRIPGGWLKKFKELSAVGAITALCCSILTFTESVRAARVSAKDNLALSKDLAKEIQKCPSDQSKFFTRVMRYALLAAQV